MARPSKVSPQEEVKGLIKDVKSLTKRLDKTEKLLLKLVDVLSKKKVKKAAKG